MGQEAQEQRPPREALQKLREARKEAIAATTARMKEQQQALAAIKAELQQGEGTVPEIATATGLDPATVLWYLATWKKYGEVAEGPAAGSYFRYRLVKSSEAEE
jgi:Fic family protein